ncbi:metallophosphoesterase family protein [Halegenticoccus tardaugens]|uniref:metallophosphoesterase family protein n=1 Tax=Halegenticoccus tardaugens TaxID=2071624 RepID=UPI00100A7D8C|nr:metallophosphoesterase family protein [Halegenticoccus tardaugens]
MEIGLISDVHGNQPALEAVLGEMPDVDRIYHCGDAVGYNPFPHHVLETFANEGIISIQGNHDRKISSNIDAMGTAAEPGNKDDAEFRPSELARTAGIWTHEQLDTEEMEYLANLPAELTIEGGIVKLVHGKPGDQDGRLYPEDYELDLFGDESILVHGHTHVQHAERFDGRLLVNPGSVGQPRDGDPRAAYAVIDLETNTATLQRVSYPIEEVARKIRQTPLPDLLSLWLEKGEVVAGE